MPADSDSGSEGSPILSDYDSSQSFSSKEGEEQKIVEMEMMLEETVYDLSNRKGSKRSVHEVVDGAAENGKRAYPTSTLFHDSPSEMTYGRRIARVLSDTPCLGQCYDGSKNKEDAIIPANEEEGREERVIPAPSLDKGWEFFEHFVLPRCYANRTESTNGRKFARAPAGEAEEKTQLYPIWGTPIEDMADFGIGVGMYFDMVRFFTIVALITAFLSTPLLLFYMNDYSPDGKEKIQNAANIGTAICTNTSWVPCPNCTSSDFDTWPVNAERRIIEGLSPENEYGEQFPVAFILKNGCDINDTFSIMNLAAVINFVLSTFVFIFLQRRMRARLDEGEQTTTDYSIMVKNPPPNAKNPEMWKQFFETAFEDVHVTLCTVALANEKLIKKLVERRKLLLKLRNRLPRNVPFNTEDLEKTVLQCPEPGFFRRLFCYAGPKGLYDKVQIIDKEIERLAGYTYPACGIFVTFETEEMQRRVIRKMTYPKLCEGVVDSKYLFDGNLLDVIEPDEPSSIRWYDLDEKRRVRIFQRIVTFTLTTALIFVAATLIAVARQGSILGATIMIIVINICTPMFVRILTSFESHQTQTAYATSVYIKVTLFRWVTTTVVTAVVSPFASTAMDGEHLIDGLRMLFTAELVNRPILQLTDWFGNVKRHFFASRAKDQRRINLRFTSGTYSIGERYTEVTKLLFLTCFYATLYPPAWYFASATLFVYYWIDKFCMLRVWRQGPKLNGELSIYSVYFFLLCAVTYAVMATYNVAMFPFDNACETNENLPEYYKGEYVFDGLNNTLIVFGNEKPHKFCQQDLLRYAPAAFNPLPSDIPQGDLWMSPTQQKFLPIYSWICIGILTIVCLTIAVRLFIRFVVPLCFRRYKSPGKQVEQPFSQVDGAKGYIPVIDIRGHSVPFLMCETSGIDSNLIGWRTHPSETNNLVDDIPQVFRRTKSKKKLVEDHPIFSPIMHWPQPQDSSFKKVENAKDSSLPGTWFRFLFQ